MIRTNQVPVNGAHALALEAISHSFGARRVLDRLDLYVGAGEIVCLLGASGSGKTTALRLAAGLETLQEGAIIVAGRRLRPGDDLSPDRRGIGLVFQDYALFPHLSVADNIGFGVARSARAARIAEMLDLVGLRACADRRPAALSGGQRQRVALARALAPRPSLLLMDEPFAALDETLRARLRGETIALLRRLGTAALIVTHDAGEAMSVADRVAVIEAGRVVQQDQASTLYRAPATAAVADALGPTSHIAGRVARGGIETAFGWLPVEMPLAEGSRAVIVIRPEAAIIGPTRDVLPHVTGIVRAHAFSGARSELTLEAGDGTTLRLSLPADMQLAIGAELRLGLKPAEVFAFPG